MLIINFIKPSETLHCWLFTKQEQKLTDCHILEGYFLSPLEKLLPGIVPEVAQKAHFQILLPIKWPDARCKPVCLHLAGTGDHVRISNITKITLN